MKSAKSKRSIDWKHPVTLVAITTMLGAAGWMIDKWYARLDSGNLRAEIENPIQAVGLVGNSQPTVNGQPVFCDTVRLSLILAHNQHGTTPIAINSISLKVEPLNPSDSNSQKSVDFDVDVLALHPYGVAERKTFVFMADSQNIAGRYIESLERDGSWTVDSNNILTGGKKDLAITLKPGEEPLGFNICIQSKIAKLSRAWFSINYDAGGMKHLDTNAILIQGLKK
jgi:hypothetical protein